MAKKTRTAADVAAAVKLGAIAPDAVLITAAEAERIAADAANRGREYGQAEGAQIARRESAQEAHGIVPAGEHGCGIPGCRHGATVAAGHVTQPDRQVKVVCTVCGAIARMTARAIHRAGGMPTCADGTPMTAGERRHYTPRSK